MRAPRLLYFLFISIVSVLLLPFPARAFLDFESLLQDIENVEQSQKSGGLGELLKELEQVTEGAVVVFTDVPADAWFKTYVDWASGQGIIGGYKNPDGTSKGLYGPGDRLTVGQWMKIAELTAGIDPTTCTGPAKAAVGHWAESFYACAADRNFTLASLNPEAAITRGQALRLIFEAFGVNLPVHTSSRFSDVPASHPEISPIEHAADLGIVSGDAGKDTFRPDDGLNRAEAAKLSKESSDKLG
jgi:hypothetical protein